MADLEDEYDDDYGHYDRSEPRQIFCDGLLMPNVAPASFLDGTYDVYSDPGAQPSLSVPRHERAVYAREQIKDGCTLICVDFKTT